MENEEKIKNNYNFVVCCLLLRNTVQYSPISTASAASKISQKNKKAKKAFNEYMSQNEIAWPTSGNLYLKQYYSFKYIELGKVLVAKCVGMHVLGDEMYRIISTHMFHQHTF